MTLAKLKTPMKNSFERVNGDLKEIYSSLNKYSKALDKVSISFLMSWYQSRSDTYARLTAIQTRHTTHSQQ